MGSTTSAYPLDASVTNLVNVQEKQIVNVVLHIYIYIFFFFLFSFSEKERIVKWIVACGGRRLLYSPNLKIEVWPKSNIPKSKCYLSVVPIFSLTLKLWI